MTILITGGAGFVGSHLCERLISDGHFVICYDNFDSYYSPEIKRKNISELFRNPNFRLVESDIRDKSGLETALSQGKVDVVVHLAAMAGVRPSIQRPELYYDVNITGTLRLLETMRSANVKKLVFGSSSSIYGNNDKIPFSETDNVDHPISPYAASKKAGELLCYTYSHLYSFDVFCLRFFTVYGPRQRPDMAIHQFAKNIADGKPITLYGDGTSRRDYTFVDDIVAGIEKAITRVSGYEVINLGESSTISLIDLIHMIEEEVGVKAIIRWLPMQPGDVLMTNADIKKARMLLDYDPQYSVKQGIQQFCQWLNLERNS